MHSVVIHVITVAGSMMMVACLHIVMSKQVTLFVVLVAAAVGREQATKIV